MNIIQEAAKAKKASAQIRSLDEKTRNKVLSAFARKLKDNADLIIKANEEDIEKARKQKMSEAFIDRLLLNKNRIEEMAKGVEEIRDLEDPLGKVLEEKVLSNGIQLRKISVPIGVIAIIFESRPNVASDCAALCFKAGNACVLKGGSESVASCKAICAAFKEALAENGISTDAVILLEDVTHEQSKELMECRSYIDLLIPRGSRRLIEAVVSEAKVPVIETGAGVCHIYVDESADLDMAQEIIINAKCSRPSVCNAMETLLLNRKIADVFLERICRSLQEKGVTIYADEESRKIVPDLLIADDESYRTEYNDLIMNLKIVNDVKEAIRHIETYGTHHSEAIISENKENVSCFFAGVDSACLYHNASTRFTDGGVFGLGAEIGISTQKLHARGPMGLSVLTTYTYILEGSGQIR